MNTEQIVIALGSFCAMALCFRDRLWAAVVAGILAWKYPEIALLLSGVALFLFVLLEVSARWRQEPEQSESEIIDVEFTVKSE